jgi:hypothetical protein
VLKILENGVVENNINSNISSEPKKINFAE